MKRILLLVVALLLMLSGCMGAPPMALPAPSPELDLSDLIEGGEALNQPARDVVAGPVFGGQLNIAIPLPRTLNPLLNSDPVVADLLRLIFEPLVVLDEQSRPVPNPAITQSVVFSPDGNSLALTLRDNITWEDGTAITTADVAFSIDVLRHSAPATAIYRGNVANIASHSIIDARSIQINLHSTTWAAKYMLAFPIIPAEYYRPVSMTNLSAARNMHPMGNGPFRFYSYELAEHLVLFSNHTAPGGRPFIQRVNAIVMRDIDDDRVHAFEQGVVDVLLSGPGDWGRYAARGKNRAGDFVGGEFDFIGFNFNRTLFADYEVRAAIAHSFDAEYILRRYYEPQDGTVAPINPVSWLAADGLATRGFDIPAAQQLFAQLGFLPGPGGVLERRLSENLPAVRLSMGILVNEENAVGVATANVLSEGLRAAGAQATVTALPFEQFTQRISAGDFDIVVGGINLENPPNLNFLSSQYSVGSPVFGYRSEELDMFVSMMNRAASESSFHQAATALQHYVADNLPLLGVAFRRQVLYTSGRVGGDVQVRTNDIFANVNSWYLAN